MSYYTPNPKIPRRNRVTRSYMVVCQNYRNNRWEYVKLLHFTRKDAGYTAFEAAKNSRQYDVVKLVRGNPWEYRDVSMYCLMGEQLERWRV